MTGMPIWCHLDGQPYSGCGITCRPLVCGICAICGGSAWGVQRALKLKGVKICFGASGIYRSNHEVNRGRVSLGYGIGREGRTGTPLLCSHTENDGIGKRRAALGEVVSRRREETKAQGLTHHQDGGGRRWPRVLDVWSTKIEQPLVQRMWM